MDNIANEIAGKDRVFGKLCAEAESSYENANFFAALACLFVLSEQVIKYSVDQIDGNFNNAVLDARLEKLITDDEFLMVNHLRETRNLLFHESHYSLGTNVNGINHPMDDDDTKKDLYEIYSQDLFYLVSKLI